MYEKPYFNPLDENHVFLLKFLGDESVREGDKVDLVKFGERTQHIFRNGMYCMTINWGLI